MTLIVPEEAYHRAIVALNNGGVIAYPTEAVYGLGCDPHNEQALKKLLRLKQREQSKGVLLIASQWEQVASYTKPVKDSAFKKIMATWPGPFTWVFPKSDVIPCWITGKFDSIALRITAHPQAKRLCDLYEGAIVSTSANITGDPPCRDSLAVYQAFGEEVDYILPGRVGDLQQPTEIRDALTCQVLRPGGESD